MGNFDTPDSMVALIFAEIALNHAYFIFYIIYRNIWMVVKIYSSIIQIKFNKLTNTQSIKQYLRIDVAIGSVIFGDLMGLFNHIMKCIRNIKNCNITTIIHYNCTNNCRKSIKREFTNHIKTNNVNNISNLNLLTV